MTSSSREFSEIIRSQAGYDAVPEIERPVGDVGIGRGGAAIPRQQQPVSMSAMIRAARSLRQDELLARGRSFEELADG